MPRFFFDTHDNDRSIRDEVGLEIDGHDKTRSKALEILAAIARDELPKSGNRAAFSIRVRDENGMATYSGALKFEGAWLDQPSVLLPA